jgi:hypothetical protein
MSVQYTPLGGSDLVTTPILWTPKPAALRDLILLMLHKQGAIIDGTGRVASRIREYFTLPDTKTINTQLSEVLGLMEQTKLIKRSMNEGRTRTYGIELLQELTAIDAAKLEESHKANLALFIGTTDDCEVNLTELGRQCQLAYRELQGAASRALRRDTSGRVAINVKGVLKAIGITGEPERRLRYYLKELGLICSHNQCDDTSAQLWWWTISTDPLDAAKLRSMASGERSFEASQERRKRERSGTPEAGPVTVRKVETEPATKAPAPEGTGGHEGLGIAGQNGQAGSQARAASHRREGVSDGRRPDRGAARHRRQAGDPAHRRARGSRQGAGGEGRRDRRTPAEARRTAGHRPQGRSGHRTVQRRVTRGCPNHPPRPEGNFGGGVDTSLDVYILLGVFFISLDSFCSIYPKG